jgi:hypothetical protein
MYALSRERVYNCHPDNDALTALIVAETWLPSHCLAMDARSDSDIPAFRQHVTISSAFQIPPPLSQALSFRYAAVILPGIIS